MPGVPSGRGCDNCRKSKKKCDEVKPVCTRCARRGIECVGAGEKRYKFMEEGPTIVKKRSPKRHLTTTPSPDGKDIVRRIAVNPTNNATLLGQGMVAAMKPQTSLRYNLMWAYGGYLTLVPRRLGLNEALDTAVDALVTTHASFSSCKEITVKSLTKYSKALGALRRCLDDPVTAGSSETLCAVSVLLLVQHMTGSSDLQFTGHAEGAAKILKARKNCAPRDAFERLLLLSLRGPVLFEGLFNPNINLDPIEWKELVQNDLDAHSPEGEMLVYFSQVPDILDRVKANPDGLAGLLILQAEMRSLYFKTRRICDLFRRELNQVENPGESPHPNPFGLPPTMLHAHTQRFYGISITVCLYMNYILVAMRANEPELSKDASYLALEVLSIAENALQYRPFGAAYVTLGLVAGVMAVDKPSLRILLESWAADYWEDFNMSNIDFPALIESFRRLDPFASADTPDGWPEAEEAALYDPVLYKDESESPSIVDFIS
ncbi:hypothetical protein ASPSYDRAFT_1047757 [Aspergillus sydowii CBS 593.65]|uniref:Zn(2)-C6 fungal-type domain-containing protein n=1 Tax=Aspergillus sydowii CBS 593.65 TaxID=1036612 RepID=A0A1L9TFU3_9EURO|nr:uncharacterized protein ASPSYDRAFT_1047757 [Aspergillus sydowii CBS 593.65]OJJ58306.1 hypothetical protein ASPSYDRAFT_1047757 [Aspergillus sydowii CBS 593.65]